MERVTHERMKQKHVIFILLAALLLIVGLSYSGRRDTVIDDVSVDGQSASEFTTRLADVTLLTLEGETVTLAQYAGMPLVLNAWAIWCPFCKKELPDFATVQEEFAGDVLFISISGSESAEAITEYLLEHGLTDRLLFLRDPSDSFYNAIGGFSMPETLFISATGAIVEHKRGPLDAAQTRARVAQLFN